MALVLADRVRETTTVTGTGTATLLGAAPGYQSFSAVGNANTTYYVIANQSATEWEVGIGTYTSSGTTLSRDTVLSSSNSGSLVNFSAGTKDVFVDYPAGRAVYEDAAGNVDGYPITGGTINNTTIGATTPAAGTFTTLTANTTFQFGASSANYGEGTGGATTKAVEFKTLGSDTNVAYAIRTKGTGAIDLAAGSSGVNISNGGTVTAITGTATGSSYTSIPSVVISAPTTAGGVQAIVEPRMQTGGASPTIVSGGTGYTVGDVLTVVGGTGTAATITVSTVSGGVITAALNTAGGNYSVLPTNPASVTGGTGSSATFNFVYAVRTASYVITNAGSGYVEQPTVTFSGGGGSGAAAYATVGGASVVRSIGGTLRFFTPGGESLQIVDAGGTLANYFYVTGRSSGNPPQLVASGSDTNIDSAFVTKGTGNHRFFTNNAGPEQLRVAHTASAVNYVQVTGAATGGYSNISAAGSDANTGLVFQSKGTGYIGFAINASNAQSLRVVSGGNSGGNIIQISGSSAGAAPSISAANGVSGTDTNIDLTLTPKGTGNVRFGTYTASMALTIQGYIEVKDSGGTVRKLAVIA